VNNSRMAKYKQTPAQIDSHLVEAIVERYVGLLEQLPEDFYSDRYKSYIDRQILLALRTLLETKFDVVLSHEGEILSRPSLAD
jgi:hypothetical protein